MGNVTIQVGQMQRAQAQKSVRGLCGRLVPAGEKEEGSQENVHANAYRKSHGPMLRHGQYVCRAQEHS